VGGHMSKRSLQKESTYNRILEITRNIYLDQGYHNTSTKQIALQTKLSQGTIFLHFKTKKKLLEHVVLQELSILISDLETEDHTVDSILQLLVLHEAILSRTIKDYTFLPSNFQAAFDQVKSLLKDRLFDALEKESKRSILDLFGFIDLLLALVIEDLLFSQKLVLKERLKKYRNLMQKFL
jgi:AcrR family transcriptional regulator